MEFFENEAAAVGATNHSPEPLTPLPGDTEFIDDTPQHVSDPTLHMQLNNHNTNSADAALPPNSEEVELFPPGTQSQPAASTVSVASAMLAIKPFYMLPTKVMEKKFLPVKTYIAGYVMQSIGSKENAAFANSPSSVRGAGRGRATKKQKTEFTQWHALFLCDDHNMVKVWCRANSTASEARVAAVAKLGQIDAGMFVAIWLQPGGGPVEVSSSNPAFQKFAKCTKDLELQQFRYSKLAPEPRPNPMPAFALAASPAPDVEMWSEIDNIVHTGPGTSFEVNATLAVLAVNGRHKVMTARTQARYLSGFVQDAEGTQRRLSVWAHVPAFLAAIPEDVDEKHVVVRFSRLRIKNMANAGPNSRARTASVTNDTSFRVLETSFEEFSGRVADGAGDADDLDGFF